MQFDVDFKGTIAIRLTHSKTPDHPTFTHAFLIC